MNVLRQACVACTLPEDNLGGMTMPDRENVIRAVDICFDYWLEQHRCLQPLVLENARQIKADAIAMMKEPEAVKPKKVKGYNPPMYTIYEYECEECKSPMMNKQPYCMGCGRRVIWNA